MGHFTYFDEVQGTVGEKAILGGLIVAGLFLNFFGVRFFHPTLFVSAFVFTFVVVASIASAHTGDDKTILLTAASSGLVVGTCAVCVVKLGMVLIGLASGTALAYIAYVLFLNEISSSHNILFYVLMGIAAAVGAFVGFKATRVLLIVFTSLLGSLLVLRSIDLLAKSDLSIDDLQHAHLSGEGWALVIACGVMMALGIVFQFRTKSKGHSGPLSRSLL